MAGKYPGATGSVGYWGRSPWKRIQNEQLPEKAFGLLYDKLISRGQQVYLYQPVTDTTPGVSACSCTKDTNSAHERPCVQCYGVGLIPGFKRFLHDYVWFAATESAGWTLTECTLDTRIKPHRILMDSTATTSIIETTDKAFTNADSDSWDTNTDAYIRQDGSTITVEFSTDSGGSWFDISVINGAEQPIGTGTIRLRITMTRPDTTYKTPAFEVSRLRHVESAQTNQSIEIARPGAFGDGQILLLRPWVQEQIAQDGIAGQGLTRNWLQDKSWTMPLNVFDARITPETADARVRDDQSPGPHPFFEHVGTIKAGIRVAMSQFNWNEEFGVFTHQAFAERRPQDTEVYYSVF